MNALDEVFEVIEKRGAEQYGSEPVSQLDHALQCAHLAEHEGASDALITAALLHDIGHLVDAKFELGQQEEIDRVHENIGAGYLRKIFPSDVTEPVRLHVPAKRYLCHVDPAYFDDLSPASVRSLQLQGGVFTDAEATAFISHPYAKDAVDIRRWDDLAKVPGAPVPLLNHFKEIAARCQQVGTV